VPYQILQPWWMRRSEARHRPGELLAQRGLPLSSGLTRTEHASPTALRHRHAGTEGTPDHPGPAVRGSRARMRRRRRCRHDRATVAVRARRSRAGSVRANGPYPAARPCSRRRPTRIGLRRLRGFRMPACPGARRNMPVPLSAAPNAPRGLRRDSLLPPARLRRRRPSHPLCRPDARTPGRVAATGSICHAGGDGGSSQ